MRVGVDLTPLAGPRTGVGRFTDELVKRLVADPSVDVAGFALTLSGRRELRNAVPTAGIGRPAPAGLLRRLWSSLDLPPVQFLAGVVDVVHGTNFVVPPSGSTPSLVTVHDLFPWTDPELVPSVNSDYPLLVQRAIDRGSHVHTVSESVRSQLIELLDIAPDRVHAIANGSPPGSTGSPLNGQKIAGASRYVLGLGTMNARKNFTSLVTAFGALDNPEDGLRLVIAGADGPDAAQVHRRVESLPYHRRSRVHLPGSVSDRDRNDLLAGASVVVCPSLDEGFGLVPLEAMRAGVPIAVSEIPVHREVCGEAVHYFDPHDSDQIADRIADCLRVPADPTGRVAGDYGVRLDRFSWDRSATDLIALYRTLMQSH